MRHGTVGIFADIMPWIHVFLICCYVAGLCFGVTKVELDHTTCLLRNTYAVGKSDVHIIWKGTQIENCHVDLNRAAENGGKMCIYASAFNVSKDACTPNIQIIHKGEKSSHFQFTDCDTREAPSGYCVTSDALTLKLEANSSSSIIVLWINSVSAYHIPPNSGKNKGTVVNTNDAGRGLSLTAIIGIICGVFIPIILIVIVIAVIFFRRTEKSLHETQRKSNEEDTNQTVTNGNIEGTDTSSTPFQRVTVHEEEDDVIDQSVRLSVNV